MLRAAIYFVGHLVCHQLPERSLWIAGAPLPVCARCAGIYAGALLALLMRAALLHVPTTLSGPAALHLLAALHSPAAALREALRLSERRATLVAALALLAMDWSSEALGLRPAWMPLRVLTGAFLGWSATPAVEEGVRGLIVEMFGEMMA